MGKQSNSNLPCNEMNLWSYIPSMFLWSQTQPSTLLILIKKPGLFDMSKWHYKRMGLTPQSWFHFPIFTLSIHVTWIQPTLGEEPNKPGPFLMDRVVLNNSPWLIVHPSIAVLSEKLRSDSEEVRIKMLRYALCTNLFIGFGVSGGK